MSMLSENATNATRDPETGVAAAPGELAVTKPWKQRFVIMMMMIIIIIMMIITIGNDNDDDVR